MGGSTNTGGIIVLDEIFLVDDIDSMEKPIKRNVDELPKGEFYSLKIKYHNDSNLADYNAFDLTHDRLKSEIGKNFLLSTFALINEVYLTPYIGGTD